MKVNDLVRVYPEGQPEKAGTALVVIYSSNERAIALGFGDNAPFVIVQGGGAAIHPEHGLMMLAKREALGNSLFGPPWGPWIEMFGRGHFVIEELP